jgi:hypothetical protein
MGPPFKLDVEREDRLMSLLKLLPWLVLVAGIGLTVWQWHAARLAHETYLKEEFDFLANDAVRKIESRISRYKQVLQGTAALFASSREVTRSEFRTFVTELRLGENYPGIQGWVSPSEFPAGEGGGLSTACGERALPTLRSGQRGRVKPIHPLSTWSRSMRAIGGPSAMTCIPSHSPGRHAAIER